MNQGYFAHERALIEPGARIGPGTRVWAFAHVLGGAVIGRDCNICDQTFIENDVVIGDRVTIKCGVQVWDGMRLEDDVFIGPNATLTNDPFPRSKQYPEKFKVTHVRRGASVGANATILPGVEIGQHAMVGAGAVVTKAVPPYAIVTGNPARVRGFVTRTSTSAQSPPGGPRGPTRVEGVSWIALGQGGGSDVDVPFAPKSIRVLRGPSGRTRQHEGARQRSHQIFLCAAGTCSVLVDDGCARETLHLNEREAALYVPPLVWVSWFNRSQDSSVVILSSDEGGPDDLISDYEAFVRSHGNPDGNGQDQ